MSVFGFRVADESLHVFASPAAVFQSCSGAALSAQDWLFFAVDGSPLRLEQGLDGRPYLRPWASCSSCSLPQMLPYVRALHDPSGAESLAALCQRFGAELA
ncbi:hypothetical protein Q9Q94_11605 [Uliginosibacterium sp. 31-16]|uniref:hypothetical protein n=1 Tax=Uliginosibacterium sp. 31-16 TaxID=3068315 RepID=UPI00273CF9E7|nr:hypothetical protein [Uliginosibacterium sp. 31-16]MDP5240178.1 hypothetical protein [Uliginosibacterium sp. 31-16]